MATVFKLYLSDGSNKKTLTENHPKLNASEDDFVSAGAQLQKGYNMELVEATIQSETTVYTAA